MDQEFEDMKKRWEDDLYIEKSWCMYHYYNKNSCVFWYHWENHPSFKKWYEKSVNEKKTNWYYDDKSSSPRVKQKVGSKLIPRTYGNLDNLNVPDDFKIKENDIRILKFYEGIDKKRVYEIGVMDEKGNLVLKSTLIKESNLCDDYDIIK